MLSGCFRLAVRLNSGFRSVPIAETASSLFVNRFARAGFIKLSRLLNEREKLGTISSEIFAQTASSDFLDVLPRDILALGRTPQLHSECRHGGNELEVLGRLVEGDFRARSGSSSR
jgi:hypothetical protein